MATNRFSLSSLITISLLLGFLGFGVGYNWPLLREAYQERFSGGGAAVEDLDYSEVEAVYDALRTNYAGEFDVDKLIEGAKRGLVEATGDPYTEYLDEAAAKQFQEGLSGRFSGIGAEIAIKQQRLVVVAPLAGSPAKAAGLAAGDHIGEINGESTADMSVETAVAKIRGDAGTKVTLTIVHGNDRPRKVTITRQVIEVPSVTGQLKTGGIGYIKLGRFDDDAAEQLHTETVKLKQQGADKFVLDLRDNPGGLLNEAVQVADEFLEAGRVIVEERRDGTTIDTKKANSGGDFLGTRVVVLVNEGSASASEIIAGALQDNDTATVVGEQTFGKGSVQELVDLQGKSVLKVTIALWYTPAGRNITKEGIKPDVGVKLSEADFDNNRDPQLDRALRILRNPQ